MGNGKSKNVEWKMGNGKWLISKTERVKQREANRESQTERGEQRESNRESQTERVTQGESNRFRNSQTERESNRAIAF